MPWKEQDVEKLRYEFVLRALSEDVPFTELCREYGIPPKTGYKWKNRFLKEGREGLQDRSRRPHSSPGQLTEEVVCEIVRLKGAHSKWGPRKIRNVYGHKHPSQELPSESSFKRVLERAGLVKKRRRRRVQECGRLQARTSAEKPNDLWTVDLKGSWYTSEGQRCEPLTVRDDASRFILNASVPPNAKTETVRSEFERIFDKYGLPGTIRTDNGPPFACVQAPWGLTRLSAWWLALGIDLDRIDMGCPSQNGGHERMHRDIAYEIENQIPGGLPQQAAALETWRQIFNHERPHEALNMQRPAQLYRKSSRRFKGTPEQLDYPPGLAQRKVRSSGEIGFHGRRIFLSQALQGWTVGLKPRDSGLFSVYFVQLYLGILDLNTLSFRTDPHDPEDSA